MIRPVDYVCDVEVDCVREQTTLSNTSIEKVYRTGSFFQHLPPKKTKTQGQNSSKKLKKKTQPLGGLSLPYAKLKKKTKFHETFSSKLKIFKGGALFTPFLLTNIFKNRKK